MWNSIAPPSPVAIWGPIWRRLARDPILRDVFTLLRGYVYCLGLFFGFLGLSLYLPLTSTQGQCHLVLVSLGA